MKVTDIKNPKFLSKLEKSELEVLSKDIREFIIENVSKTGGHLSSNLGVVDLTIAVHKVYNSPKDKIIFDVGHQSYTHKILTGRAEQFNSLRQYRGLSGFQKISESEHDPYEAGHSSTSLSAALGYAISRDMDRRKNKVIAVIGDGSICNGVAHEAINHIGAIKSNMLIILNDNEMSISKNVGAIHNTLDKIRVNHGYNKAKRNTKNVLNKLPLGSKLEKGIDRLKTGIKNVYDKDGALFEEMGLKYFGPINGHDYDEMLLYLEMIKKVEGPVLLHVITTKGKGYKYSEEDSEGKWHGVGKFDVETGKSLKSVTEKISYSEVISNHLINIQKLLKNIVVISPAMTNGSKLENFEKRYPRNFIDVGIAEEHALVLASSLALNGKLPFVSIYSTFLQRGYDQVSHDIARINTPVVIGVDRAGLADADGETHQGIYDISFLSHIPNMMLMAPYDSEEAGNMLYTAFISKRPTAIRYSRIMLDYKEKNYKTVLIGTWTTIKKGMDAYIITYGDFIDNAKLISEKLELEGINVEIVNARFIKPFDKRYLNRILKQNKHIFIYEETVENGSLSSLICSYVVNNKFEANITSFNIKESFVPHGSRELILRELKLDVNSIVRKIKKELDI